MLLTLTVIFIAILILSLGLFVFARSIHSPINRYFAFFTILVSVWIVANYLGSNYKHWSSAPTLTGLDFLIGSWISYTFWRFATELTKLKSLQKVTVPLNRTFLASSVVLSALLVTGNLFTITHDSQGLAVIDYSDLYPLYSAYNIIVPLLGLIVMIVGLRQAKRRQKSRLQVMLGAMLTAVLFIVVPNQIIPKITTSEDINLAAGNITYLGLAFFVFATSYAIVKHHLFDVRLVFARTVSYFLTLAFLAGLYFGFTAIVLSFVSGPDLSKGQQLLYMVFIIGAALTYGRVKSVFDKVSNSLFYRDAYDPQQLIAHVNSVMVSSVDASELLKRTSKVMIKYLEAEFLVFSLNQTPGEGPRMIGSKNIVLNDEDAAVFSAYGSRSKNKLVVSDELENSATKLGKTLHKHDVDMLIRLRSSNHGVKQDIGYMLFGPKKSGNVYSKQDIQIIQILADELVIAIQNALRFEEIADFNKTLQDKVTHATKELQDANEELKTLDALKDDFISTASHQLRSPAVSVHDALHMLNYPNITAKDRRELLSLAEGSSERLVTVVRTMLNMARIQAGRFTIDSSEANIVELVQKEIDQVQVLADQKSITLDFKKPDTAIAAQVDVAKIAEAIANYIENAIKYSLDKTTVTISLNQEADTVRFEVADQGMGVPEDEQANLFGRFYRAANARQEQPDGNGIGLYVVKTIVEGHKGEAYYRPGEPHGSIFGFWIKLNAKD